MPIGSEVLEEQFKPPLPSGNENQDFYSELASDKFTELAIWVDTELPDTRSKTISVARLDTAYQNVLNGIIDRFAEGAVI